MIDAKTGRTVPGTMYVAGREFIYLADDGNRDPESWFELVTESEPRNRAKSGGALLENCRIKLPDGQLFYALSYKGDLPGWRSVFLESGKRLKLPIAFVDKDEIIVDDGRRFKLSECRIEFFQL
jgi:hypothetical protein